MFSLCCGAATRSAAVEKAKLLVKRNKTEPEPGCGSESHGLVPKSLPNIPVDCFLVTEPPLELPPNKPGKALTFYRHATGPGDLTLRTGLIEKAQKDAPVLLNVFVRGEKQAADVGFKVTVESYMIPNTSREDKKRPMAICVGKKTETEHYHFNNVKSDYFKVIVECKNTTPSAVIVCEVWAGLSPWQHHS